MQTSHSEYRNKYAAGELIGFDNIVETYVSEHATDFDVGVVLAKGTADDQVLLLDSAAEASDWEDLRGIAIKNQSLEKTISTGVRMISDEDPCSVLIKGRIAVLITDTVAKGDLVYFTHTTGGSSTVYTYRNDLDTDKAIAIPARFVEAGTTGQIVPIDVDFTMGAMMHQAFSAAGHTHE
jgi:hypothetical protein